MSNATKETRFETFVHLAETGELQNAERNYLGFKLNPYYLRDLESAIAVAHFVHPILTVLKASEPGEIRTADDVYDVYDEEPASMQRVLGAESVALAKKVGFIAQSHSGELYLTPQGESLTPYSVYKPETLRAGCLVAPIGGLVVCASANTIPFGPAPIQSELLNFGIGSLTAMALHTQVRDIRIARAAYKASQES